MVSIQNGRLIPIPFAEILDPATGRTRVRMVDVESKSPYTIARRYMIRLSPEDLSHPGEIAPSRDHSRIVAGSFFRKRFEYLVAKDL